MREVEIEGVAAAEASEASAEVADASAVGAAGRAVVSRQCLLWIY